MPDGPTGDFNDRLSEDQKQIEEVGKHTPAQSNFDDDEAYMTFINQEKERLEAKPYFKAETP